MPPLVRFMVIHGAAGFVLAAVFVAALVVTDPGRLGTLLLYGAGHWWPLALLWFFTGLTFGGAQIATAAMTVDPEAENRRPRGGSGAPLVPARIRIRAPRQRRE